MMKLWILRAIEGNDFWEPWYDKTFGMVVRAKTEADARRIAADNAANEGEAPWLDATASTCELLTPKGKAGLIIQDHYRA